MILSGPHTGSKIDDVQLQDDVQLAFRDEVSDAPSYLTVDMCVCGYKLL